MDQVNAYAYEVVVGSGVYWLSVANNGQIILASNRAFVLAATTGNGLSQDQSLVAHPQDEYFHSNLAPAIKLLADTTKKPVFFIWQSYKYVAKNNRVYMSFTSREEPTVSKFMLSTLTKKVFG